MNENEGNSQDSQPLDGRLTRLKLIRTAAAGGLAIAGTSGLAGPFSRSVAFGATSAPAAKRGGTLRVGVGGGSTSDTLDAHSPLVDTDIARAYQLYEPLAIHDVNYKLTNVLAESIEPGRDASHWTVRLKPNMRFSDGRPITADDVIFSLKRIIDPKSPKRGASQLSDLVKGRMQKLDQRTVRFTLSAPNSEFPSALGEYYNGIVPTDYDPKKPIGSGPFKLVSFTPGQRSTMARNPNYQHSGQPFVDSVVIIDIADDSARLNALLSGQVDAIAGVPSGLISQVQGNSATKLLQSHTGNWTPFVMRVDAAPFNDVRVRQAFRLMVDRGQMAKQAFSGQAQPANDLFSRWDPSYNHGLPQRPHDIEQAKSLLAKAGKSDLTVELTTANLTLGILESAQVFAQQAKAAGVTINLRKVDSGAFYGKNWLSYPLTQDYWYSRYYLGQVAQSMLKTAPYNETHFTNSKYARLYLEARAQLKQSKRAALIHEMQAIEWNTGGYIVPTFNNQVDAYSAKTAGFVPSRVGGPLGDYGFRRAYFVS